MITKYIWIVLVLVSFLTAAQSSKEEQAINKVLDQFHQAAANADAKTYFNLLNDDAIFLGTDASERWTKPQFSAFVLPYFNQGKGWLYVAKQRNISLVKQNSTAFFDEVLENKKYGNCRGSGVLVLTDQGWKISQYSLSVLVPNDIAGQITEKIKNYEQQL